MNPETTFNLAIILFVLFGIMCMVTSKDELPGLYTPRPKARQ